MHRLYVSPTSPYARMARAVVIEKGLGDRVQEVFVNPFDDPAELIDSNPAGLVPALERADGGRPILDSRLICGWLDHLPSDAPGLIPDGGPARLAVRQAEALAQTMTDRSVALVLEKRRPEGLQFAPYMERWRSQLLRMAAAAEDEIAAQPAPLTMGTLCLACALGHLDFRHAEVDWRGENPQTAAWLDAFVAEHESLSSTAPRD